MFIERIKKFFSGEKYMLEREPAVPIFARLPNGIPDLGDAILQPGLSARKAATAVPLPVGPALASMPSPVIAQPAPLPEPVPAIVSVLDIDYDNISQPPRSPEMIHALIAAGETEEQRARRMHNDIARFRYQRDL